MKIRIRKPNRISLYFFGLLLLFLLNIFTPYGKYPFGIYALLGFVIALIKEFGPNPLSTHRPNEFYSWTAGGPVLFCLSDLLRAIPHVSQAFVLAITVYVVYALVLFVAQIFKFPFFVARPRPTWFRYLTVIMLIYIIVLIGIGLFYLFPAQ